MWIRIIFVVLFFLVLGLLIGVNKDITADLTSSKNVNGYSSKENGIIKIKVKSGEKIDIGTLRNP